MYFFIIFLIRLTIFFKEVKLYNRNWYRGKPETLTIIIKYKNYEFLIKFIN